ncbi:MAG TPA: hypothetical protein VMY35_17350 [Phycisphaerae bacterium]|nr:hypothetical protein [Thermoguttaceae bacterium]HUX02731.1 hypothetical protein [Phycisphaerae bacterium]
MATDLTALDLAVAVSVAGSTQKGLDLSTPQDNLNLSKALAFAFGTGAGKGNQAWHDRRLLAASAAEGALMDLAGVLKNAYGETVNFANVKALIVFNRSDETFTTPVHAPTDAEISVGGAAATEWLGPFKAALDAIKIPAGGVFVIAGNWATGWPVVGGISDLLEITNEDGADEACYEIILIGESG